jgi:hypothetical protein
MNEHPCFLEKKKEKKIPIIGLLHHFFFFPWTLQVQVFTFTTSNFGSCSSQLGENFRNLSLSLATIHLLGYWV